MTEKGKKIEEMAKAIIENYKKSECSSCKTCVDEKCSFLCYQYCKIYDECSILYKAGYRKQSEVAKEFVDRLILELIALRSEEFDGKELAINGKTYKYLVMRAKEIAAEYGVEVEK